MELSKTVKKSLVLSIILSFALYLAIIILNDIEVTKAAVKKLDWMEWLIILSLSILNYGLRFFRWHFYIGKLSTKINIFRHLAIYLTGFAFTTTPGKAGEAIRSIYLKKHGVSFNHSLSVLFVERFIDVVAVVLLALFAALTFENTRWIVLLMVILVLTTLPILHSQSFYRLLNKIQLGTSSARLARLIGHLLSILKSAASLLKLVPFNIGLLLGLIAWAAEGYAFYLILIYFGIKSSLLIAIGIYSIGILAGAISFIPGGLGSTEAVMVLLLSVIGMDIPSAIAATLVCRIATLWFAVAIGVLVMSVLEFTGSQITTKTRPKSYPIDLQ